MGVGGQRHAAARLPQGKTRYPLYRRLVGPQDRSGQVRKFSPLTGIRSPDRPARPVTSVLANNLVLWGAPLCRLGNIYLHWLESYNVIEMRIIKIRKV